MGLVSKRRRLSEARALSVEEVTLCIEAIRAAYNVTLSPVELYAYAVGEMLYLTREDPKQVPVGSIYTTWVVSAKTVPVVRYFRSRRGVNGDDTLPPSDHETL